MGDMLELGRYRKKMHADVGQYAKRKKIDIFLGFGDLTKYAVESFGKNGIFFKDEAILKDFLKKNIQSKDVVLIKGSRGMKMERYIDV
jgi:UDP-N-acetylmuramoyl-tripeptide--D-alanyl-D-alanine ligase